MQNKTCFSHFLRSSQKFLCEEKGHEITYKVGPLPFITSFITPISRVSYNPSETHLFIRPFIGATFHSIYDWIVGAHLVMDLPFWALRPHQISILGMLGGSAPRTDGKWLITMVIVVVP